MDKPNSSLSEQIRNWLEQRSTATLIAIIVGVILLAIIVLVVSAGGLYLAVGAILLWLATRTDNPAVVLLLGLGVVALLITYWRRKQRR